ncbi:MAG TPA: hypothetical protein VMD78_11760 [Candidatus Baltobacteraceae bacterium]|nr:hypothetical protein [Candidatus Baltobacteraceae bacterium]
MIKRCFYPAAILPALIATFLFVAAAPRASAQPTESQAACDRACLEGVMNRYLDAMVAHNPSQAPLAPDVKYAQDNVRLKIGQALWASATARGKYIHDFADPEQGDVGAITVIYENGVGAILIVRLKVQGGLITEAEQFVAHDPHGAANYEKMGKPDAKWLEPIPMDQRETRAALDQAAYMYYEGLQLNDGQGVYAFTPDCNRIEDATRTTNQARPQNYGHSDEDISDFTTMTCTDQYKLGFLGFTTGCRDRRFMVTDVERGAVLANAYLDFDGTITEAHLTDGRVWKVPPYFMTPRTNQSNEAYRIEKGSISLIEMTMYEVPFNIKPAF